LAGLLPIWGGWFIIGPILFPVAVILFCFVMGIGFFTTGAGFVGIAVLFENIADKLAERKRLKRQAKRNKEVDEENFKSMGRKW
jgi:hypothetical protein